jgi:interferon gamma-inducible protein 30
MKTILNFLFIASFIIHVIYSENAPYKLDVHMETGCPYSRKFIKTSIKPLVAIQGYEELVDINIFPFGNASEEFKDGKWHFDCPDGELECYGNLMETCAIKLLEKKTAINLIVCLSQTGIEFDKYLEKCEKSENNIKIIKECMTSYQGNQFQHEIAQVTLNLQPQHEGVPWTVLNNIHRDVPDDLISFFCSMRDDKDSLKACNSVKPTAFLSNNSKLRMNNIIPSKRQLCLKLR